MDSEETESFFNEAETLTTEWSDNPVENIFLGSPSKLISHVEVGYNQDGRFIITQSILLPVSLALQYLVGKLPSISTNRPSASSLGIGEECEKRLPCTDGMFKSPASIKFLCKGLVVHISRNRNLLPVGQILIVDVVNDLTIL